MAKGQSPQGGWPFFVAGGNMIILGAGMAGCLAGALERSAEIYEAGPAPSSRHRAVLRFREDKIARTLGIPFRAVRVFKSAWQWEQHYTQPDIIMINDYSRKVSGRISERSITSLETVTRYVAPDNLHMILAEMCGNRVRWSQRITELPRDGRPVISTIPMRNMLDMTGTKHDFDFRFEDIQVYRYRVRGADVHQTVYYPARNFSPYRATLTGENLIIECTQEIIDDEMLEVFRSFGLRPPEVELIEHQKQSYGKIRPLPTEARKRTLLQLTTQHGVYSLGRYATWRNILLDDVFDDFFKIRAMINMTSYDLIRSVT
jgi:hypothetical protein